MHRWVGALLFAAALQAGAEEQEGEVAERGPTEAAPELGASVQASVSGRGDRDLTLRARFRKSGIAVSAGAETVAGPAAPERRAAVLGLEAEAISGLTVQIEARVMPEQQRVSSAGGELWLRHGWLSAGALARTTSFGSQQLVALGAGLEIAGEVLGLESAVRATAWRLDLTAPRSRDPWNEFGQRTLDWADRWEAGLTLRRPLGPLALTASAGVAQSARWNLGGSAGAGAELQLGSVTLEAAFAAAQTGAGFVPQVSGGISVGAPP